MAEGTRFVVDLGDVKLSGEIKKRINSRIQKAVLDELAAVHEGRDLAVRMSRGEWLGFIARLITKENMQEQLARVEKQIVTFAQG